MKTFVIPSIKMAVAPTASENLSAGYPIGQHWFDTATGKEYYHSSDGVWEELATTHKALTDKNSEAAFQHIDTTVTKPTLAPADMLAVKDSVTGKMVLTPKNNFPTVDAVNLALATKADKNDTLSNTADIRSLENVINSANINQEATATATGVDTVALPKTAANTGMSVQLFGRSAENLVVNGDFRNGTTGWTNTQSTISVVDGKLVMTYLRGDGSLIRDKALNNSKHYIRIKYSNTNTPANNARLLYLPSSTSLFFGTQISADYSAITTPPLGTTSFRFLFYQPIGGKSTIERILLVDLEQTFGAGNEPTKEQCDLLFANYFEGIDNVLGTGRIRSVNSAGLLPSYLYFNGGQLRSNGITKDEIRKGTNGYELIQRINPADGTVRATPVITPIAYAGLLNSNSNGTVYFEPIIADAGVYGSNLSVQLTDYPIASFESIRKYANGTYTELNIATAVIASGGLSFTHPDLASGDLVMFTYAYKKESVGRSMTLTHYDNRYVKVDTANGKTYRIDFVVTNGVVMPTATEV